MLHGAPPRTKALLFPFVGISERGASEEKGEVRELCGSNESERRLRHPSDITATARNTSRLRAVSLAFHGEKWVPSATLISARGLRLLHAGSSMGTSPRAGPPLTGAAPESTPYLQRAGTPPNCDPQLVSPSPAAGVFNKASVCV